MAKYIQLEKYINLYDAKLIADKRKPIKTKRGLSKVLKSQFPQSKHLYEQILRLEKEPFDKRYNKALVSAIAKLFEVKEEDLFAEVKEDETASN